MRFNRPSTMRHMLLSLLLGSPLAVPAIGTEQFIDDVVADFSQGDFTTSTLTFDGLVLPPHERIKRAGIDTSVIWDIVEHRGTRYLATGHDGIVYSQKGSEDAKELARFNEPSLYAIEHGPDRTLYVGASPGGMVYTLDDSGTTSTLANTGESVIWDLLRRGNETLVATGPKGAVISVSDDGTTETLVRLENVTNVLHLASIPDTGDIAAATAGPGYIVRIDANGKATVLLDPEQEEIRRVGVLSDGSIIGAVNGVRSPGEKLLASGGPEAGRLGSPTQKPRPESFIARVYRDGFAEEWWTSPESPIHDFTILDDDSLIVAAGGSGNLYKVTPQGNTDRLGIADESFVTRLATGSFGRILVATGSEAALYELDPAKWANGTFISRVFDARGTVAWGRLHVEANPADGKIYIATRSGNTREADKTWTDWSPAKIFEGASMPISSPIARFIQYRFEFEPAADKSTPPSVDLARLFYSRPNQSPRITNVTVGTGGPAGSGGPGASPSPAPGGGAAPKPSSAANGKGGLQVNVDASDPNGDPLLIDLDIQPLGGSQWVELARDLDTPRFPLDAASMPDGRYRIRATVRDDRGNPAGTGLSAELTSSLFLIDNTQPRIFIDEVKRLGPDSVTITFRAEDAASLITSTAWRYNAEEPRPLLPNDGFFDEQKENFLLKITGEAARKGNLVTITATDEAGNNINQLVILE